MVVGVHKANTRCVAASLSAWFSPILQALRLLHRPHQALIPLQLHGRGR